VGEAVGVLIRRRGLRLIARRGDRYRRFQIAVVQSHRMVRQFGGLFFSRKSTTEVNICRRVAPRDSQ